MLKSAVPAVKTRGAPVLQPKFLLLEPGPGDAGTGSRRCWNQRPVLLQSTAPGGEDDEDMVVRATTTSGGGGSGILQPRLRMLEPALAGATTGQGCFGGASS